VEKVREQRFEIATRFFKSLAMTRERFLFHCEETFSYAQGKLHDEAISTFSTSTFAGMTPAKGMRGQGNWWGQAPPYKAKAEKILSTKSEILNKFEIQNTNSRKRKHLRHSAKDCTLHRNPIVQS